jgi:DNA repair photolyase
MDGMKVREVSCKTALSKSGLPEYDYSLNPYKGCAHGCTYCYVPNIMHIRRDEWGGFVEVKLNIPRVLAKELKKKEKGTVGISTVTDPYQPIEGRYKLTRYCLEQLLRKDFPVSIITKSPLVTRDIDILKQFSKSEVGITITTLDDDLREMVERDGPSVQSRFGALKKLIEEGIDTYVFLGPLLPSIEIEGLEEMIGTLAGLGIKSVYFDELNLKPGIWEGIEEALKSDAALRGTWKRRLFKEDYYKKIFNELKRICIEKGIELRHQEWVR